MHINSDSLKQRFMVDIMINIDTIAEIIKDYTPRELPDDGSPRGAVIVPIFEKNSELYMLFTKRTENLSTHKGQISFPGGKRDETDKTLFDCALRETWEEIGIKANKIKLLGELDQIKTTGSNVLLSPFVCVLDYPFTLAINKNEVDEIIEVPVKELFNEENWDVKKVMVANIKELHIYYFFYRDWSIWGATGRILHFLTKIIK